VLGQSSVEVCVADHKRVQTLRQTGGYLEAHAAAARCASSACPLLVREDCSAWFVDLEERIPSLILELRDERGRDLVDVRVYANGQPLTNALDGRAIPIDPGRYRLRFEASGQRPLEQEVVVRETSKKRKLTVVLRALPAPAAKAAPEVSRREEASAIKPALLTLGAVAAASLGAAAALGGAGKLALRRLDRSQCKPDCSPSEVERVNETYRAAYIALGVGAAAATAAVIVYFAGRRRLAPPTKLSWRVDTFARGAGVSLQGAL
jgi:hypothetical protein